MTRLIRYLLTMPCLLFSLSVLSQGEREATSVITAEYMREAPALSSSMTKGALIPVSTEKSEVNPRRGIPSVNYNFKATPQNGDPLVIENQKVQRTSVREPILTFDALENGRATPTDPTGAVGPNHYVSAYNSGFRVYNRSGTPLTPHASLANIWPGESLGDPIVLYDRYVDRWVITQFSRSPNGILVAYSQGPDPVNDGWFTYRFNMSSFPDYPKYSIWSDGLYMTANKDQSSPRTSEVVFVFERDQMIVGAPTARSIGFSLPGIVNNGFYSPLPFHADGQNGLPPAGTPNFIAYMQDDVWSGVSSDHVKLWEMNINWSVPGNSTISQPVEIPVAPFDGLFDNGSFSNLPQPSGPDIDALQATMMYMMPYYRFGTHNSVLMNWVVDLDGSDDYSGIRWVEFRQNGDGQPWSVYQEGTYTLGDGVSRFCGSMAMDAEGNIGMGFSVVSPSVFPSLRYTGRLASDPLGQMTVAEEEHATGTSINPSFRYGDYAQLVLDPTDDLTFWHIGEYFTSGRFNGVAAFQVSGGSCPVDIVVTTDVVSGTSVETASNSITANNTIFAGATAIYSAGQSVTLTPGFHAQVGSSFSSLINGCSVQSINMVDNSSIAEGERALLSDVAQSVNDVLKAFPNPARNQLRLAYPFEQGTFYQANLLNYTGQLVLSRQVSANAPELDLSHLGTGNYILLIKSDDQAVNGFVQKIQIRK